MTSAKLAQRSAWRLTCRVCKEYDPVMLSKREAESVTGVLARAPGNDIDNRCQRWRGRSRCRGTLRLVWGDEQ